MHTAYMLNKNMFSIYFMMEFNKRTKLVTGCIWTRPGPVGSLQINLHLGIKHIFDHTMLYAILCLSLSKTNPDATFLTEGNDMIETI